MELKTITINGQDFYLVPKCENKTELNTILIEPIEQKVKTIFYVKTRYMWGKEYDQKLIDGKYEGGGWWKYRREEWENGDFKWIIMFGGEIEARKEDVIILESWYQKTISDVMKRVETDQLILIEPDKINGHFELVKKENRKSYFLSEEEAKILADFIYNYMFHNDCR